MEFTKKRFWLILFVLFPGASGSLPLPALADEKTTEKSIAVFGDSISTGALSHPDLAFNEQLLTDILNGKPIPQNPQPLPITIKRLHPSTTEFVGAASWVSKLGLFTIDSLYFDVEESSWATTLAHSMGAASVYMAAEDGARAEDFYYQIVRLLEQSREPLPLNMFVFYSGNDVCGPTLERMTSDKDYAAALEKGLRKLQSEARHRQQFINVYLLHPLAALQVVTSPDIQQKKVKAHNQDLTCAQLQERKFVTKEPRLDDLKLEDQGGEPLARWLVQYLPKSPADYCPNIFTVPPGVPAWQTQARIAERLRSYSNQIAEIVKRWQGQDYISVKEVSATSKLLFTPDEIANDCFHLAAEGQRRLAQVVKEQL